MKDIPIPFHLSKNDRDRRGLPIPFIVYRDMNGVPHFTVDDTELVNLALSKKLCGLCGKPLKVGQMWLIGGPLSAFAEDGMFASPPAHEDCARYAVQVCPYIAASNYSRLIEDKTLKADAVHDTAQVHNDGIVPTRPLFFVLARTSGFKVTDLGDGSDKKYILPRRPWKDVEFWKNGRQIARPEADKIAQASELPLDRLKWWPA